jgi:hypothetical protein
MPDHTTRTGRVSALAARLEACVPSLPNDHPAQVVLRTYSLALALSIGPTLLPFLTNPKARVNGAQRLLAVLRREFGPTGFAFAITLAVGGGFYLQKILSDLEDECEISGDCGGKESKGSNPVISHIKHFTSSLSKIQKAFILNSLSSAVAIFLLHSRRRRSRLRVADIPMTIPMDEMPRQRGIPPTLDLTLMLLVRAMDSFVHGAIHDRVESQHGDLKGKARAGAEEASEKTRRVKLRWVSHFDALVFSVCSARCVSELCFTLHISTVT